MIAGKRWILVLCYYSLYGGWNHIHLISFFFYQNFKEKKSARESFVCGKCGQVHKVLS